jgi:hypothetical protein
MPDCKIDPVRILSQEYTHEGQQFRATAGEIEPRTGQLVIAILRSNADLTGTKIPAPTVAERGFVFTALAP